MKKRPISDCATITVHDLRGDSNRPGVFTVPNAICDSGLTNAAVGLYLIIRRFDGQPIPAEYIEQRLRLSRKAIDKAISELRESGFVEAL